VASEQSIGIDQKGAGLLLDNACNCCVDFLFVARIDDDNSFPLSLSDLSTSLVTALVLALFGFISTAIKPAPPGRLRLVRRPSAIGSPSSVNTIGIVFVAAFAASGQFGAFHKEPGNLCLMATAWWGWEDSNF
jgi:hypothetical protein